MSKINFKTNFKKILGDTYTPVGIYLRFRDQFPNSIIMESSDYHGNEHSYSYICFDPISKFVVENETISQQLPSGELTTTPVTDRKQVTQGLQAYASSFSYEKPDVPYITHGLFGYSSYNAVRYFEDIEISAYESDERAIPDLYYQVYRYVLVYSHEKDEIYIYEHLREDEESGMSKVVEILNKKDFASFKFESSNDETSNFTDEEFLKVLQKGMDHCFRGDVFQIVLSRRFQQSFKGDEFQVYRALRHINPSPYLFFFDFGGFKIFGSSPEAQIVIENGQATIFPIAGTFRRTGNDEQDTELAKKLFDDPKENSEHVMLVDLARNDLSRHGSEVTVKTFKEIQFYSHVIHLVSKVVGKMDDVNQSIQLVADTFPAGTLSGAPKHMAMRLIDKYENNCRGYYGGAIGYLGFEGEFNHAIMIRTILSKNNNLYYQAGAGVVAKSTIESELQEVHNKLLAPKTAIELANKI